MFGTDQSLNNYLNSLLAKGFYATVLSTFVKIEEPATTCCMTNMQRIVVRIRNTVNFYYENGASKTPFVGGEFDTLIAVLLDDDGSVYEVNEDRYYNPESIVISHEDADFIAVAEQKGEAKTDLYYDMVNNLLHGTPFQMIVLKDDAYQLMDWSSYCDQIPLVSALLKAQVKDYLSHHAQNGAQAVLNTKIIHSDAEDDNIFFVEVQNTLSIYGDPPLLNNPILKGTFKTTLQVVLDEDRNIYNVNIDQAIHDQDIVVHAKDKGLTDLISLYNDTDNELFRLIAMQLMQGSRLKVMLHSGRQQYGVTWNNYCDRIPLDVDVIAG